MDKKLVVVFIAIGTVVVSTLLQVFLQGRELSPKAKRFLWISLVGGIVALIAMALVLFAR